MHYCMTFVGTILATPHRIGNNGSKSIVHALRVVASPAQLPANPTSTTGALTPAAHAPNPPGVTVFINGTGKRRMSLT